MRHWIQKHILRELSVNDVRRYKDLRPSDVEGNMFMYHLDQLVKDKLVEKVKDGYQLTTKGKTFVSSMSLSAGERRIQPKVVVMLDCKNNKGEQLLFKWRRQPYYGLVSLPFSKTHFGKSVEATAIEELKDKSGLTGKFKYRGDVYVQTTEDDVTVDHMLVHVFSVTNIDGKLFSDELTGTAFWGDPMDINSDVSVAGFLQILKLLKNKKSPFFEEIISSLD